MARVTVEDCIERVPNRFELVLLAAQRARDITAGAPLLVDRDNDKNPVVALREIAEGKLVPDELRREIAQGGRREAEVEVPDEEAQAVMAAEQAWAGITGGAPQESDLFAIEPGPEAAPEDEGGGEGQTLEGPLLGGEEAPSSEPEEQ